MTQTNKNPVDLYFMDARSKLLDIAAFMDRVERSGDTADYRYQAFLKALRELESNERAESVLNSFSDPTKDPSTKASPDPAAGAWKASN
ncbi:MAG: hypothetical protein ACSHX8_04495 [Opitutaceae bacterium]